MTYLSGRVYGLMKQGYTEETVRQLMMLSKKRREYFKERYEEFKMALEVGE